MSSGVSGSPERSVGILGPYTSHNFGDDLIGAVLARHCLGSGFSTVLVPGLGAGNCFDLGAARDPSTWSALRGADALIVGGGGILGNSGRVPSNTYLRLAAVTSATARIRGKPMCINGVGAGPLARDSSRRFCRFACRHAHFVGVRDQESFRFLQQEIGVPAGKITLGADIALLWPDYIPAQAVSSRRLGIQFDVSRYDTAQANALRSRLEQAIAAFAAEHQAEVALVSNGMGDTGIAGQIRPLLPSLRYTRLIPFLSHLGGLRAIVTSHLHLAIAAYASRIPPFSIYVREKTKRFFSQIGRDDRAVDISTATPDQVQSILDDALAAEWTDDDEAQLQSLRSAAKRLLSQQDALLASVPTER